MSVVIPVILCGGSGTRLWPLSRSDRPKQFISLLGDSYIAGGDPAARQNDCGCR